MSPLAWLPFSRVASDLARIAAELRLVLPSDLDGHLSTGTDGSASLALTIDAASDAEKFGARIADGGSALVLPPLIVHFFDWYFVPRQSIAGLPASGSHHLRMTIVAQATYDEAIDPDYPVDVTTNPPSFDWVSASLPTPDHEAGIAYGDPCEYYWYLVTVTDRRIVGARNNTYIFTTPPFLEADPS